MRSAREARNANLTVSQQLSPYIALAEGSGVRIKRWLT
jgi:hypothetical protein